MKKAYFSLLDLLYFLKIFIGSLKASRTYNLDTTLGDKSPVIIFPGIWNNWYSYKKLAIRLNKLGHPVFFINSGRRNLWHIDDMQTQDDLNELINAYKLKNISILAHSKGVLDYMYIAIRSELIQNKTEQVVSVNAPWNGTFFSKFTFIPYMYLISKDKGIYREIKALSTDLKRKIVNIRPKFDNSVLPNSSLKLEGSDHKDIQLTVLGHNRSLASDEFFEVLKVNLT